jgi:hypothetical protein
VRTLPKRSHARALNKRAQKSNACNNPGGRRSGGHPMIRFLFRTLGLFLLAMAFVFLVYDGTKSIANQQFVYLRVSELWADIDQHSLNQAQEWIKTKALWAWDPYAQKFFEMPSWLVLAIISTFLVTLGRKKKKLIGYARD